MGQIFHACAYDIQKRECFCDDADKFHANCYAHSGVVMSIHYLLKKQSYRVMWGGGYIVIDDNLAGNFREEDLLGFSVYNTLEDFENNNQNLAEKSYYDKVKFIGENSGSWKYLDIWDEAIAANKKEYLGMYKGFLVNHDKKMAINLEKYLESSIMKLHNGTFSVIDPIPVLTETGGGVGMLLFDGITVETTENLAGTWGGDLLQILDESPDDYTIIDCCFGKVWERIFYCYHKFGVDEENRVLNDDKGTLLRTAELILFRPGRKKGSQYIKAEKTEEGVKYSGVLIEEV